MKLIVVLTKEVTDQAAAEILVDIIKMQLAGHPDIKIEARTTAAITDD